MCSFLETTTSPIWRNFKKAILTKSGWPDGWAYAQFNRMVPTIPNILELLIPISRTFQIARKRKYEKYLTDTYSHLFLVGNVASITQSSDYLDAWTNSPDSSCKIKGESFVMTSFVLGFSATVKARVRESFGNLWKFCSKIGHNYRK
jgi:hypothetical protein